MAMVVGVSTEVVVDGGGVTREDDDEGWKWIDGYGGMGKWKEIEAGSSSMEVLVLSSQVAVEVIFSDLAKRRHGSHRVTGKLEVENDTPIPASEFFHIFTNKPDNLQNITDPVHEAELHEVEDWHSIGSVK
ncbi:hypothetical protein K1719_002858 [Acacia pycnantha]|nr:hypothetical protein K1719_002858 [Acacia pycnantha]